MQGNVMQDHLLIGIAEVHVFKHNIALERDICCCIRCLMIMFPRPPAGVPVGLDKTADDLSGKTVRILSFIPSLCSCINSGRSLRIGDTHQSDVSVIDLRLFIEQHEDTVCTRKCHDDGIHLHRYLVDRHREIFIESKERGQRTYREPCCRVDSDKTADNCTEDIAHVSKLRVDGADNIGICVCLVRGNEQLLVALIKLLNGFLFVVEDLDDLLAGHRLFDKTV